MYSFEWDPMWYFSWWHCDGRWTTDVAEGSCSPGCADHCAALRSRFSATKDSFFCSLMGFQTQMPFFFFFFFCSQKVNLFAEDWKARCSGNAACCYCKHKLFAISEFHPRKRKCILPYHRSKMGHQSCVQRTAGKGENRFYPSAAVLPLCRQTASCTALWGVIVETKANPAETNTTKL